ncbi:MAG TPA: response regulator transcription factor [Nevskiales bacterium]|nr:response regulator transcription factor [Nevskiales bacterium]
MHILLIEDNVDLAANICEYLQARGHVMDSAGDGVTGLHLAVVNEYDAIILDVMLPGMDGLALCHKLRKEARRNTPVLMLTARDTLGDKLQGFESGADDYLVKPFLLEELEARLQALVRRTRHALDNRLQVADLILDLDTLEVQRAGRRIELTPTSLKLLALLMRESPRVVSRRQIEQTLWGDDPPDSDALRAHIYALRSAIDKPFPVKLLHTLHSTGYRLAVPDATP